MNPAYPSQQALIVGGGIGGLAAALALSQVGRACAVFEQAAQFAEIGAGLQVSPNAMRRLHALGLASALAHVASFPSQLQVRSAASGAVVGSLPLGDAAVQRYGAPYATLHRADLHALLLAAVKATPTQLRTHCVFNQYSETPHSARVIANHVPHEGAFVLGADGVRSAVRQLLLGDGAPRVAGQVVYRALALQSALPEALRSTQITVWLGPAVHVVAYPVRGGALLNVAAIVHGRLTQSSIAQDSLVQDLLAQDSLVQNSGNWDQSVHTSAVHAALRRMCTPLNDLIHALPQWQAWTVYDREPIANAHAMAQGRVALLGDAAHPMRPYLAQGAGMAIEDAVSLAQAIQGMGSVAANTIPAALQHYARSRWLRCAQVQRRAKRNGVLFHLPAPLSWARDAAIGCLGQRVLDVPWLYKG